MTRQAMIDALQCESDFLVGSECVADVADEWLRAGFDPHTAEPWWRAGCFDAARTGQCLRAGLDPEDLAARYEPGMSRGYAVSNCDLSVERAVELAGKPLLQGGGR